MNKKLKNTALNYYTTDTEDQIETNKQEQLKIIEDGNTLNSNAKNRFGLTTALKEHLLSGKPITFLESLLYFGVTNPTQHISGLRKEGWIIKSRRISYAATIKRASKYTIIKPAENLPIRDIQFTEWWVSK